MTCASLKAPRMARSKKPGVQDIVREALAYVRANELERALACLLARPEATLKDSFACYLIGLINVNRGEDAAALSFYDKAIALNARNAEALEGRARLMRRLGRFKEAIADYEALLRFMPARPDALCNLGEAYEAAGLRAKAIECYERALKDSPPGYTPALTAHALLIYEDGRTESALEELRAALAADPNNATAWYNCGVVHAARDEDREALDCFAHALHLVPGYPKALYGAAGALQKLGRAEEALSACAKLLRQTPSDFDALFLTGNVLYDMRQLGEALAAFDKALQIDPTHLGALCNKGATLRELGRFQEATQMFDAALERNAACIEALLGRGIVEFKSSRIVEARAYFERALAVDPSSATAWCGRGLALQHLGDIAEARSNFERALALKPDLPEGHANLGALQLLLGDFQNGWEGYEYRTIAGDRSKSQLPQRWPVWNGEDIRGKKLIVIEEAAHGDAFMLARYFPHFADLGVDAAVECRPHMLAVLSQVPGVRLVTRIDPEEHFDYQAHVFSLPRAFKTRVDRVPACIPYMKAEPDLAEKWAQRIGSEGFKVGICWQGNPSLKIDGSRSAPLSSFAPLAAIDGVRLISLQKGFGVEQTAACGFAVETLDDDFDAGPNAFLDTAAVMANLDLVVSVDTSIAHLAGAMGRPVWVALKDIPEWRWMLNREDSPWYPTMRLFRQSARGDWASVFNKIAAALKDMVATRDPEPALASLFIPAAVGELIDKITILEIKAERIPDPDKLANVKRELALLQDMRLSHDISSMELHSLAADLKRTNMALWDIEDAIRQCERTNDFGPTFVELARRVYQENDKRAAIKRNINIHFGSAIVEEKYYSET